MLSSPSSRPPRPPRSNRTDFVGRPHYLEVMRSRVFVAVGLSVALLAGCGGETADHADPSSSTTVSSSTSATTSTRPAGTEFRGTGYRVFVPRGWLSATEKYQQDYPDAKFDLYVYCPAPAGDGNDAFSVSIEDTNTCASPVCAEIGRIGEWNDEAMAFVESHTDELSGGSVTSVRVRERTQIAGTPAVWMSKESTTSAIETLFTYRDGRFLSLTLKMTAGRSAQDRDAELNTIRESFAWR